MERPMVPKLEAIKGGGGSVKVGTTGTVGSLITRELKSMQCVVEQLPMPSSKRKPPIAPTGSFASELTTHNGPQSRASNEASSSGSNGSDVNNINQKIPGTAKKTTHNMKKSSHRIPMLGSDEIAVDTTPCRPKLDKKGPGIVEVVDLKCGNHEKVWSSPIANRLKKLSFSKLSETVG